MKRASTLLGACLSVALLSACGVSSFSSSTPVSVIPNGHYGSHGVGKNAQFEKVFYSFTGSLDGDSPYTGRLTNMGGTLYGTTSSGGANNPGAIFNITRSGAESAIYSFSGNPDGKSPNSDLVSVGNTLYGTPDGASPESGLTSVGGTLYGTTHRGGANDKGTVYALSF